MLPDDPLGELEHLLRGGGVQRGGVLVEQQELRGFLLYTSIRTQTVAAASIKQSARPRILPKSPATKGQSSQQSGMKKTIPVWL